MFGTVNAMVKRSGSQLRLVLVDEENIQDGFLRYKLQRNTFDLL